MLYDLIMLGNDSKGWEAALLAAKLDKRVAVVTPDEFVVSTNGIREAALMLTGIRHRADSPGLIARRRELTLEQLRQRTQEIDSHASAVLQTRLQQSGVDLIAGQARFTGPHEVEVVDFSNVSRRLHSEKFLMAVGTRPLRPSWVPFDGETIFDSDEVVMRDRIPKSMIVVGGDPLALEQAMIFAVLGTRVAIVDAGSQLLEFCDHQVANLLRRQVESYGVQFRLGRSINAIEKTFDNRAVVRLAGGKNLIAECVSYASGRRGRTDALNLKTAGLMVDEQGRLWCNEHGQTWVDHIYGIGDVVGFPTLASGSLDLARRFAQHAFGQPASADMLTSFGLSTIPELAMVGATDEQLHHDLVAYEVGVSHFGDGTCGHLHGSTAGMLKLLFHRESLQLLGVHCCGESASELIRIGQTVMSVGGSIEAFRDESFRDAALSECYRLAAEDGLRRLEEEPAIPDPSLRIWRPRSRRRRRLVPNLS